MSKRLKGERESDFCAQDSWFPATEATLKLQLGQEGAGSLHLLPAFCEMGQWVYSFHLSIHVCMNPETRELGRTISSAVEAGRLAHGQRHQGDQEDGMGKDGVDSLKEDKARARLYQPTEHMHHLR